MKPVTLVPVHGEAAHLEAHAALGQQHGIPNVVHARNGDMVRLFPEVMQFPGEVRTGELYLDGNILCSPDESGVKGRRRLSFGGHIVVSLCVDGRGGIVSGPELALEGLPEVEDDDESIETIVRNTINGTLKIASRPSAGPIPNWSSRRCSAPFAARSMRGGAKSPMSRYSFTA